MNNLINELLKLYFLRPENAVMTYRRALAIKNLNLKWKKKTNVDISCGDGVFSYVVAGGQFQDFFDMFINVDEKKINKFKKNFNEDIYNSNKKNFKNAQIILKKKPDYTFSIGSDWKKALLNKAKELNFYDSLILQDNNKKLKISSNIADNVYSNSIYWVKNIDLHLKELNRIMVENGTLLLQIKTNEIIKSHPKFLKLNFFSSNSLKILDRGRLKSWKSIQPIQWWLKKLEKYGFKIELVEPVFSKNQVLMWHYGLRPFSHVLVKMFNKLNLKNRTEFKKEFIQSIFPIAKDLAKINPSEQDGFEFVIKLTKQVSI